MIKIVTVFICIFSLSCMELKKNIKRNYYAGAYSLNFGFDSSLNEYYLRDFDYGRSALVPEFDSISFKDNILFISGYITFPRHRLGNPRNIDSVTILYAYEKRQSNRMVLIDTLGISNASGKIDLQIKNPLKKFYLLFLKDTLIPCAQIINSKKEKG